MYRSGRFSSRVHDEGNSGRVVGALSLALSLMIGTACPLVGAEHDARARLLSAIGTVEYQPSATDAWSPARVLQDLFLEDAIRTAERSRAAVLFFDETQVRLGPNAELTVEDRTEGGVSVLNLFGGEGWFRTKRRGADLQVRTPAATAAIRGTEFGIRVDTDGSTTVTVLEGEIDLSNEAGSVRIVAGEEGFVRPGEPPITRVVLDPEESVQWIIYYPFVPSYTDYPAGAPFEALAAGEPRKALDLIGEADGAWAAPIRMLAYLALGDLDAAERVAAELYSASVDPNSLAHAGLVRLVAGEPGTARMLFDRALGIDSNNVFALGYTAFLELYGNDRAAASATAVRLLEAHPDSCLANVTAGEVAQAAYDLSRADLLYQVALRADPENVRALLNRARIAFGSDRIEEARALVDRAAISDPDASGVQSLLGFLALSEGRSAAAVDLFGRAIELEPELGEAYLGLGLAHFRAGEEEQGLLDMLAATLLEPRISLYQSYLAKAYYQLDRATEAFAVIETAKSLDDRDPTPWLYESSFLRSEYRWAESLFALNGAIERNDNRGVYRSRSLLDSDEAVANASQATAYTHFGFSEWGRRAARASLRRDYSNASAHLLLSGLYLEEPDRLAAGRSELLQYYLLAPVNRNTFASFNEYTALFDRRGTTFQPAAIGGYPLTAYAEYFSSGGSDRFTHSLLAAYENSDGARPDDPDQFVQIDVTGKLSVGRTSDLFSRLGAYFQDLGADEFVSETFDLDEDEQITLERISDERSETESTQTLFLRGEIGGRHAFGPLSPLISFLAVEGIVITQDDPNTPISEPGYVLDTSTGLANTSVVWSIQQNLSPAENHNVAVGGTVRYEDVYVEYDSILYTESDPTPIDTLDDSDSTGSYGASAYGYYSFPAGDSLILTAGLRAQHDVTEVVDEDDEIQVEEFSTVDPAFGMSLEIGSHATVRAAVFKRLQSSILSFDIAPTTLEGFFYEQNQIARFTDRWEYAVALDYELDRVYVTNAAIVRRYDFPPEIFLSQFESAEEYRLESTVNWLATDRLGITLDNEARVFDADTISILDDKIDLVAVLSFPIGLTTKLTNRYLFQTFSDNPNRELETNHSYILNAGIELSPAGRWTATLVGNNILALPVDFYFLSDVSSPEAYASLFEVQLMVEYTW